MSSSLKTTADKLCNKVLEKFDAKVIDIFDSWLETWTTYLDQEAEFIAADLVQYNPGAIISVCLGFNVGSEQGGNRPAVVIGRSSRSSRTLLVVPLGSLSEEDQEKDLRPFECFLGELEDFNRLARKPAKTRSKAIVNQIRTISKQRIIRPTLQGDQCINIGDVKLKLIEDALISTIKTIK